MPVSHPFPHRPMTSYPGLQNGLPAFAACAVAPLACANSLIAVSRSFSGFIWISSQSPESDLTRAPHTPHVLVTVVGRRGSDRMADSQRPSQGHTSALSCDCSFHPFQSCMKPQGSRAGHCPPSLHEGRTGLASQCCGNFPHMDFLVQVVTQ